MRSRHAAIDLDWADGTHTFRLGLSEIEELERRQDRGIFRIVARLAPEAREAKLAEIMDVIRLGLVGGGMAPVDALAKVRRYVDERPLEENRDTAYAVALAALMRLHPGEAEDVPAGEAGAAETGTAASTSSPSAEAQP